MASLHKVCTVLKLELNGRPRMETRLGMEPHQMSGEFVLTLDNMAKLGEAWLPAIMVGESGCGKAAPVEQVARSIWRA